MAALEAAERKAAGVGKRRRTERDSDNRASLKKKCIHDLHDLCGELAVEANGTKAQMIERIVAARTAPPAEPLASGAPPGEASTEAPDAPPAAAAAVSGLPAAKRRQTSVLPKQTRQHQQLTMRTMKRAKGAEELLVSIDDETHCAKADEKRDRGHDIL